MCKEWIVLGMILVAFALLGGCGGDAADRAEQPPAVAGGDSTPADTGPAPPPPPPPPRAKAAPAEETAAATDAEPAATEPPADAVPPGREAAPAVGHVGRKGQGYGSGMVATPLAAVFQTKDRLQFLQVAHTLNNYKAMNGHFPKSHDEFMKQVIERNGLQLPLLPRGQEYFYDAEVAATIDTVDPSDPERMPLKVLRPR